MTERIWYVQWMPRLGTEAERREAARQGCHHDYWSELVEVAPPPSEETETP